MRKENCQLPGNFGDIFKDQKGDLTEGLIIVDNIYWFNKWLLNICPGSGPGQGGGERGGMCPEQD